MYDIQRTALMSSTPCSRGGGAPICAAINGGDPRLRQEFEIAYRKTGKKLDMGGSCVHFKTLDDLPLDVVGDTIARVTVDEYVKRYENTRTKKKTKKPAMKTKTRS